jgi:uncharacterized RDD family membrane protein YckC
MAAPAKTSPLPTGPQLDNRRIAAALIDLLIPLAGVAAAYAAGLSLTLGLLLVGVGWTLYYFFALESGDGQTLGKRAMKLRVVSADGTPATMEQIAKRTVVRILDGHIVGLIVMLATGDRRLRLGDMVAGTVVTDAGSAASAAAGEGSGARAIDDRSALLPGGARASHLATTAHLAPAPPLAPPATDPPKPAASRPSLLKRPIAKPARPPFFKRELSLPSFGKPSLPSFGRKPRRSDGSGSAGLTRTASPGPGATPAPSVPGPRPAFPDSQEPGQNGRLTDALRVAALPEIKAFDPTLDRLDFDEPHPAAELDRPAPSVEPDGPPEPLITFDRAEPMVELERPEPLIEYAATEPWDEANEPDPLADLGGRDPVVEVDEPHPEPERESLAELEPWAEQEVQAHLEHAAEDEGEIEVDPAGYASLEPAGYSDAAPAADPEDEPALDYDAGLTIKPIETVSAIDLVMQDAEERRPAGG